MVCDLIVWEPFLMFVNAKKSFDAHNLATTLRLHTSAKTRIFRLAMIIRCSLLPVMRPLARCQSRVVTKQVGRRCASSSASPPPSHYHPAGPPSSILGSLTSELDKIAPRFEIAPERVVILKEPDEFYQALKVSTICVENAKEQGP